MPQQTYRVLGPGHPRVAELRRVLKRGKAPPGRILIEGPRTVGEALDQGLAPLTVILPEGAGTVPAVAEVFARLGTGVDVAPPVVGLPVAGSAGPSAGGDVAVLVVRQSVFAKLAPSVTPQPMLALFARPQARLPETVGDDDVWLVLTDVGDPGNTGTLIRAADAFAATGVVVAGGADPWSPKAVRASAGSMLRVPVTEYDAAAALRILHSAGARIVAADASRGEPHDSGVLAKPVAVVVGAEPRGLDPSLEPLSDAWCRIDMAGPAESLNVAMAGTLLLHEACRRVA